MIARFPNAAGLAGIGPSQGRSIEIAYLPDGQVNLCIYGKNPTESMLGADIDLADLEEAVAYMRALLIEASST